MVMTGDEEECFWAVAGKVTNNDFASSLSLECGQGTAIAKLHKDGLGCQESVSNIERR